MKRLCTCSTAVISCLSRGDQITLCTLNYYVDRTRVLQPLFQYNLGKSGKTFWIFMKQEMLGCWTICTADHLTLLQTDDNASFLSCNFCRLDVEALKALICYTLYVDIHVYSIYRLSLKEMFVAEELKTRKCMAKPSV